jgi:hypothetical protein
MYIFHYIILSVSTLSLLFIYFYSFYKLQKKEEVIIEKNKQLMQIYLNSQFINKVLIDSLKISHSLDFCCFLIEQIKEYYNLQELIIIDSVKYISEDYSTPIKSSVIKFIKKENYALLKMLPGHGLKQFNININDIEYVLYISKLASTKQSNGLIIGIEFAPCLLSKDDKINLENAINLLKNRLFYE